MAHKSVKHPNFFLPRPERGLLHQTNEDLLDFLAEHILPSTLLADCALILPLLALPAPDSVKLALAVVSGSWIQWWALHILQRSSVQADKKHDAKVQADHMALTSLHTELDEVTEMVRTLDNKLNTALFLLGDKSIDKGDWE